MNDHKKFLINDIKTFLQFIWLNNHNWDSNCSMFRKRSEEVVESDIVRHTLKVTRRKTVKSSQDVLEWPNVRSS